VDLGPGKQHDPTIGLVGGDDKKEEKKSDYLWDWGYHQGFNVFRQKPSVTAEKA